MRKQIASSIAGLGLLAASLIPFNTLGAGQHHSGIAGEVFIYECPVVRPGENCDRPYETSITVVARGGRLITRLTTDEEGRFEVFLRPGSYVLIPDGAGKGTYPLVEPLAVRVDNHQITPVTIVYDSGIR
jgi:hypothetical protein